MTATLKKLGYPSLKQRTTGYYCRILNGRDVFAILQTGFGKTLCYACIEVFAGRPPELKWLLTSPIFPGFSRLFHHFESQPYRMFYGKNHSHYCDLNANQVCYTFRYVLPYFHNENKLTKLKPLISRRNFIFAYKLQYILTLKMADFILLTWLQLLTN